VRGALAALATLAALGATVASAAAQDTIRVAVVDGARVAELRGGDIEIVDLGPGASGAWRASVVRAVVVNGALEIDGRRAPAFRLRSETPIRLNGRDYPAPLDIVRSGDGLAVVNEVPLEDYVVGVLRAEACAAATSRSSTSARARPAPGAPASSARSSSTAPSRSTAGGRPRSACAARVRSA